MLGAGMLIALVASIFTYGRLERKSSVQVQAAETRPAIVAATDLPWGAVIDKNMVRVEPFLKKSLPTGAFANPAALEGRTLLYPMKAGELMLESRLAPTTLQGGGVAAIITPKKRAMAVKVDKVVGVSGFIHPGHRVDVLVTLTQMGEGAKPVTKIVLENVLVLAAGGELERNGKQEKSSPVDVITLEVAPEEGEKLALAATEGKLQLALRNGADNADVMTRGTTYPALLASYGALEPERPAAHAAKPSRPAAVTPKAPSLCTVDVVKGTALNTIKFGQGE